MGLKFYFNSSLKRRGMILGGKFVSPNRGVTSPLGDVTYDAVSLAEMRALEQQQPPIPVYCIQNNIDTMVKFAYASLLLIPAASYGFAPSITSAPVRFDNN
jgi:hypothetical protein